jgi:molybdopterin molybdotransferase
LSSGTAQSDRPKEPVDRVWSVSEHIEDILGRLSPLEPIELQLLDAQGCVLVEEVRVPVALPPFDNSSMDGYAARAADVQGATADHPVVLSVVADLAAGTGELPAVGPGEAARIMTGAPLPPGADTVIPVEWTDGGAGAGPATTMRPQSAAPAAASGEVRVYQPAAPGRHVRTRGSDLGEGEPALAAGTVLGPPQIALLAAIGRATVRVRPRPRVVVMSTGSELVPPGEELGPGRIHDSNSFMLTAAARDAGAIAFRVGAVADDAEVLRSTLEDQLIRADIVVTSGGVSVGAYDVVKEALSDAGVEFRKLAMQPGKPQGFGFVGTDRDSARRTGVMAVEDSDGGAEAGGDAEAGAVSAAAGPRIPLVALPGNPVSAYVSFELFVRPAIRTLMGVEPVHRCSTRAVIDGAVASSPKGRRQFLRGRYDDATRTVTPVGGAGSHLVGALAHANALIVVPEDTVTVEAGAEVDVVLLD